ncbi:MAG: hypothetical protein EBX52_01880 [Proteobacteria bacterium]|nr:hypothetical protein [Pseudomonadota bacterium]
MAESFAANPFFFVISLLVTNHLVTHFSDSQPGGFFITREVRSDSEHTGQKDEHRLASPLS